MGDGTGPGGTVGSVQTAVSSVIVVTGALLLGALVVLGAARLVLAGVRRRRARPSAFEAVFSPEEAFELETRLRLVAVDEWMRAEAVLHHTAVRLALGQVPVGVVDVVDVDEVRIVFSDGTTLVAVDPDAHAIGAITRASASGRVLLRDVEGSETHMTAEFDVSGETVRVGARQLLVR